jgi:hypothetical protein
LHRDDPYANNDQPELEPGADALAERVEAFLRRERARAIFCCQECGTFFDAPRIHPETGDLARKCISCEEWYPVAALGSEGGE